MGEARRRRINDPNYGKRPSDTKADEDPFDTNGLAVPDYQSLVEEYLQHGASHLAQLVRDWIEENDPPHIAYGTFEGKTVTNLARLNQISETVYVLASQYSKALSSVNPQRGKFKLLSACEPGYWQTYPSVQKSPELALEGLRLYNTCFFDEPITDLINCDGDVVATLRKNVVVLYMAMSAQYEVIDAACALAHLLPFQVTRYAGEQRRSLDIRIEKVFKPIAPRIDEFRVKHKGADRFPCLTILFFIESKVSGKVCEFRIHYTAHGGSHLVIPGFSCQSDGDEHYTPMDILGPPLAIPEIRGYSANE